MVALVDKTKIRLHFVSSMADKLISKETAESNLFKGLVVEEYAKNPDFAEAIKSDPHKAISELFPGEDFSEVTFETVPEKAGTVVIPLPEIPEDLSAEQLEAVAGGAFFGATIGGVVITSAVVGKAAVGACTAAAGIATCVNQSIQASKG